MATERVTFSRPFRLPDMDQVHAPGTFDLVVEQEALDFTWMAYRRSLTIMLTGRGGTTEAWPVTQGDLDAALATDRSDDSVSAGAAAP